MQLKNLVVGVIRWGIKRPRTKIFLCVLFVFHAFVEAATLKYAPVNGRQAVPLSADNTYFRTSSVAAPDYWSLASFYVPQYNDYACSAASVSMALNALLNARRMRGDYDENILSPVLPEKIAGDKWKELLSVPGFNGRHGVSLSQLGMIANEAMVTYSSSTFSVTITTAAAVNTQNLETFRQAVILNENSSSDILLLHFVQDRVTGAPDGPYPHVSPVGAYDAKTRRVLIFDVDRRWYEPYWAADTQVFDAMAFETKSFGHGGYVLIKIDR